MPELERRIAKWREELVRTGIKPNEVLDELESHLREEAERQTKSGLGDGEAFEAAVQRIGKAGMLNDEFEKVHYTKEMQAWKLKRILFVGSLSVVSMLILSLLIFSAVKADGETGTHTSTQIMPALCSVVVMNLLAVGGRLFHGVFPAIRDEHTRGAICLLASAPVFIFWGVFLNIALTRDIFTIPQVGLAVIWATLLTVGIVGGLFAGFETAAREKFAVTSS